MNLNVLGLVLALQLALAAGVWALQTGRDEVPDPFLSFDASFVDAIEVGDSDERVTLTKVDGVWQLPDALPVDQGKVDQVLDKLADAAGGWPVATSDATAERFEVTATKHQRHVVLRAGDATVADIYLGTSPGYRKVHARRADGGDVYSIEFSNYEAGTDLSGWLDKALLKPKGELTRIALRDGWTLESVDGVWKAADDVGLDPEKVATFVGRFTGLNVLGVVDVDLPDAPKLRFELTDAQGVHEIDLYHVEDGDDYVATSSRVAGQFEIATYIAEQMDKNLTDLAPEEAAEEDDAPARSADPA